MPAVNARHEYSVGTTLWFNHTGCLWDRDRDQDEDRDQNQDMDKWVVWLYVEHFTLHLNRDRG